MYSVLDIRGRWDEIRLYHTSFEEFLVDPNRSCDFNVDKRAQSLIIARKWLQNLTASRLRTYSVAQLYSKETRAFFTEWIDFCRHSFPKPPLVLLNDLKNVDLSCVFLCRHVLHEEPEMWYRQTEEGDDRDSIVDSSSSADLRVLRSYTSFPHYADWSQTFQGLHQWIEEYSTLADKATAHKDPHNLSDNHPYSDAEEHMFNDAAGDGGSEFAHCGTDKVDILEGLKGRFLENPKSFHLELSPDINVPLQHDFTSWAVHIATGCKWWTRLRPAPAGTLPDHMPLRLTDCHCDLSRGKKPVDSAHITFQEACMQVVKTLISNLEMIRATKSDPTASHHLQPIYVYGISTTLLTPSLLQHCQLDTELFSLCQSFLNFAKSCPIMTVPYDQGEEQKQAVLSWIEVSTVYPVHGPSVSMGDVSTKVVTDVLLNIDPPGKLHQGKRSSGSTN
ncbi:hypothetical protein PM082_011974 [Marasmius tenuissimus]|nr:hypothetical protein PM082_011974 [Marasmius tenuissimus]